MVLPCDSWIRASAEARIQPALVGHPSLAHLAVMRLSVTHYSRNKSMSPLSLGAKHTSVPAPCPFSVVSVFLSQILLCPLQPPLSQLTLPQTRVRRSPSYETSSGSVLQASSLPTILRITSRSLRRKSSSVHAGRVCGERRISAVADATAPSHGTPRNTTNLASA